MDDPSHLTIKRAVVRRLADRRIRYVLAGGYSGALYYVGFTAGWLWSHGRLPYLVLSVLSNALAAAVAYPVYRRVFAGTGPWLTGFLRFYLVCVGSLVFVLAGLPVLVGALGMPVLLAQAVLILAWPLLNYQLLRLWAFRRRSARVVAPDTASRAA